MEGVAKRMLEYGSTISKSDILAVFEDLSVALGDLLLDGYHVNMEFGDYQLTIHGVLDGLDDEYDPRRHQIEVSISVGARLREGIRRRAQLTKDQQPGAQPSPVQYTDLASGEHDHTLTPGGVGRVLGKHLKFDPADPQQGIFFVNADRRATRKVPH